MKIPMNITTKHHLLFTFSNIGNKKGSKVFLHINIVNKTGCRYRWICYSSTLAKQAVSHVILMC